MYTHMHIYSCTHESVCICIRMFELEVRAWCYGAFASINGLRLSTIMYTVANAIH